MYCQKRILNCVICDESLSQINDLRKHKKIHNRKEFSCPICSKSFKDFRELSNHKDEDICVSKEQKAPHPLEKPFSCSECDKRFSKLEALKDHGKIHDNEASNTNKQKLNCSKYENRSQKMKLLSAALNVTRNLADIKFLHGTSAEEFQMKLNLIKSNT